MNTLYLDRQDSILQLDGDALIVRDADRQRHATVPVQQVERIVIRANTRIDSSCLSRLGERGVGIVLLRGRSPRPTLMMPRRHHDTVRRLAQYRASFDPAFCLRLARALVHAKLDAQVQNLGLLQQHRPDVRLDLERALRALRKLRDRVHGADGLDRLRGLEGVAARAEFAAYASLLPASLGFKGRNRRPPRDPYNALISLAYTLLYSEAQLAAHCAGLDPAVGFYHLPGFAHEALASDLMEPARPHVNLWAQQMFARQLLRAEHFSSSEAGCMLGKAGRACFYAHWENRLESLRKHLHERARTVIDALGMARNDPHVALDDVPTGEHPHDDGESASVDDLGSELDLTVPASGTDIESGN